jgi:hypothetical protein
MTDFWTAQLRARQVMDETGLSLQQLAEMPLDEFARLTRGQTPAEAAIAAYNREQDIQEQAQPQAPAAPQGAPEPPESATQGVSVADMTMEQYALFRQQAGVGGREYGVGLLNQSGSWANAARAKAGRSAMAGNRNTVESPRLEGRYVRQDDMIDHRPSHQRLSNAANLWQGR